jgi:hypothetical protein
MLEEICPEHLRFSVDAHVHLDDSGFIALGKAAQNLRDRCGPSATAGALMLTEPANVDRFAELRRMAVSLRSAGLKTWQQRHAETTSFWAPCSDFPLLIIAGRQIISSEGLEVLAVGTEGSLPDGLPVETIVDWAKGEGALAILPWGVGKWLGRRGAVVRSLIRRTDPRYLFLGDNGGRPGFWRSGLLESAAEGGFKILSGSDALPLRGQGDRVGGFGFSVHVPLAPATPARSLVDALRCPDTRVSPFGAQRSLKDFFTDQAGLRMRRRRGAA